MNLWGFLAIKFGFLDFCEFLCLLYYLGWGFWIELFQVVVFLYVFIMVNWMIWGLFLSFLFFYCAMSLFVGWLMINSDEWRGMVIFCLLSVNFSLGFVIFLGFLESYLVIGLKFRFLFSLLMMRFFLLSFVWEECNLNLMWYCYELN